MNLDRSIQSFSVPVGGANISSIGFHAPPQEPGWPNDGTFNNQGYSSTPWAVDSECRLDYLEHRNLCHKPERQRDSLWHIV